MNKNRFSAAVAVVTAVLFGAILFFGMGIFLTKNKKTYSYFENRNLAEMPQKSSKTILDGSYFTAIETFIKEHAPLRETVLTWKTKTDMNLLKRPVVNDVIIGEDCLLPYNSYQTVNIDSIEQSAEAVAENLKAHSDQTEAYGGKFYYVAVPCQYVCLEEKYPWFLNNRKDYTEAGSKALFDRLDAQGINYIDMLEWYNEAGRPREFTSNVDNHYGIRGGYQVYRQLMERINADLETDLDVLEEGEYTITDLPNPYLGSRNRKLFGLWESEEKLAVITPNKEIPFRRFDYGGETEATVYDLPKKQEHEVLYGMYMGGDVGCTRIETDREELPSIFVYGDSFTNAVESVLWYSFDTMYSRDFRIDKSTPEEIIRKYQPDVVVCIRDYEALLSAGGNGQ